MTDRTGSAPDAGLAALVPDWPFAVAAALATSAICALVLVLVCRWLAKGSRRGGWALLERLTPELVGQTDEVAILRVALADSPALFGCQRVEVLLKPAAHRSGLYASADAGSTDPVEVRTTDSALPAAATRTTLEVTLTGIDGVLGVLRLSACPWWGRQDRGQLAIGFAHMLASSLGGAHALGQERRLVQESTRRAHQDGLTSLGNRWLLRQWGDHLLGLAQARSRTAALLLFDIDAFKGINDTLGHDGGDRVLSELGRRIHEGVRGTDLAVRLGGDEFAILTDDLHTPETAEQLAARLIDEIAQPIVVDDVELRVLASVGIAVLGEDGNSVEELLRAADQAMYAAKATGPGRWHRCSGEGRTEQAYASRVADDLSRGLVEGQLVLHYQSQVDAISGQVTGFEALARWRHPQLGLLPPEDFVPVAEQSGLMRQLTGAVLEQALSDHRLLAGAAPGASIAVNVSARNLLDQGFVPELTRLLAKHEVPAGHLTLEITEPTTGTGITGAGIFPSLERLGCPVSVSEYGTGSSSLTALAEHRAIRQVKVNPSLVSRLPVDPAAERLVRTIVTAAHTLGVSVVGEGIEDATLLEQAAAAGCDALQGYFVHPPAPVEEVIAWVEHRPGARPLAREGDAGSD